MNEQKRLLDAGEAARYIGISRSLFMQEYSGKIIKAVPMPGTNKEPIRTLLFDVRDLDDLIDAVKGGRTKWVDEEAAVSISKKAERSGRSNTKATRKVLELKTEKRRYADFGSSLIK